MGKIDTIVTHNLRKITL